MTYSCVFWVCVWHKICSRDPLTRSEAARLLRSAHATHLRSYLMIALYSGARTGAILELTWDRVDLEHGFINFGNGNGNKKRPKAWMHARLQSYLRRLPHREGPVVCFRGQRVTTVKTGFRTACKAAGLEGVTPHSLRHTCVTWKMMAGEQAYQVAREVGMSIQMIDRIYGHFAP